MNDYDVRIAHTLGEHVWHQHDDADEFFLVLDGQFDVAVRHDDGSETTVELHTGDAFVVPRGTEHRPSSPDGSILMFEPSGTSTTGDLELHNPMLSAIPTSTPTAVGIRRCSRRRSECSPATPTRYAAASTAHGRGWFAPHRDNTAAATTHRTLAVTINLDRDYDGGDLCFPELGSDLWRPDPGAAIVFSCGLLHEVVPVTRGSRHAVVTSLF